jgi:hypothetical protein
MDITVPTKEEIKATREAAGLFHEDCARLTRLKSKNRWYEYEAGSRNIELSRWELFLVKIDKHTEYGPRMPASKPRAVRSAKTSRSPGQLAEQ